MVRDESYEIADYIEKYFLENKEDYKDAFQINKDKITYTITIGEFEGLLDAGLVEIDYVVDCEEYNEIDTDVRGILGYRGFDTNFENGDLLYYEYK